MEPPGITRHRRPFLAPLYLGLLAAAVLFALGWAFYSTATTTVVFLVSPVAKAPGAIDDPPVSPEGEARAEQTAAPLIERMHRSPVVFRAAEARATVKRAVREHGGGTILIIASGAALREMVQELAGTPLDADAADDAGVYVVSVPRIGRAHIARFRL